MNLDSDSPGRNNHDVHSSSLHLAEWWGLQLFTSIVLNTMLRVWTFGIKVHINIILTKYQETANGQYQVWLIETWALIQY